MSAKPSSTKPTKAPANSGRRRVRFEVDAKPGSRVAVAGSFNAWDPESHILKEARPQGHFQRFVYLPPGDYEYKFVINGDWSADPNCQNFSANSFGSLNSVLHVAKAPGKAKLPQESTL